MAGMKQSSILQGVAQKGSVLQVVSTTKTDTFTASVASSAFTAVTGLTATITPVSTSSKIFIMIALSGALSTIQGAVFFRATRDSSAINVGDASSSHSRVTSVQFSSLGDTGNGQATGTTQFLDPPSSTSALEYGVEFLNPDASTRTVYVNRSRSDPDSAFGARSTSTITLMEVAG